jgi:hypothetical protein
MKNINEEMDRYKYSVSEIIRMRCALQRSYPVSVFYIGTYAVEIEEKLRTYMMNGTTAENLDKIYPIYKSGDRVWLPPYQKNDTEYEQESGLGTVTSVANDGTVWVTCDKYGVSHAFVSAVLKLKEKDE